MAVKSWISDPRRFPDYGIVIGLIREKSRLNRILFFPNFTVLYSWNAFLPKSFGNYDYIKRRLPIILIDFRTRGSWKTYRYFFRRSSRGLNISQIEAEWKSLSRVGLNALLILKNYAFRQKGRALESVIWTDTDLIIARFLKCNFWWFNCRFADSCILIQTFHGSPGNFLSWRGESKNRIEDRELH